MSRVQLRNILLTLFLGLLIGFVLLPDSGYRGWLFFAVMTFYMGGVAVLLSLGALGVILTVIHYKKRIGKYFIYVSVLWLIIAILGFAIGRGPSHSGIPEMVFNLNWFFWWPGSNTLSWGMPWNTFTEERYSWIALAHVVVYWELVSLGIVTVGYMLVPIVNRIRHPKSTICSS